MCSQCAFLKFSMLKNMTPRLDHIVHDTAPTINPLRISCYADEDGIGQVKRLAMASNPVGLDSQVMNRYAAYCCVRWLRRLTS